MDLPFGQGFAGLESAVKKSIVQGLPVFKENYTQILPFFSDPRPSANPAVSLDCFPMPVANRFQQPCLLDP
jgi:hypothetical protein